MAADDGAAGVLLQVSFGDADAKDGGVHAGDGSLQGLGSALPQAGMWAPREFFRPSITAAGHSDSSAVPNLGALSIPPKPGPAEGVRSPRPALAASTSRQAAEAELVSWRQTRASAPRGVPLPGSRAAGIQAGHEPSPRGGLVLPRPSGGTLASTASLSAVASSARRDHGQNGPRTLRPGNVVASPMSQGAVVARGGMMVTSCGTCAAAPAASGMSSTPRWVSADGLGSAAAQPGGIWHGAPPKTSQACVCARRNFFCPFGDRRRWPPDREEAARKRPKVPSAGAKLGEELWNPLNSLPDNVFPFRDETENRLLIRNGTGRGVLAGSLGGTERNMTHWRNSTCRVDLAWWRAAELGKTDTVQFARPALRWLQQDGLLDSGTATTSHSRNPSSSSPRSPPEPAAPAAATVELGTILEAA